MTVPESQRPDMQVSSAVMPPVSSPNEGSMDLEEDLFEDSEEEPQVPLEDSKDGIVHFGNDRDGERGKVSPKRAQSRVSRGALSAKTGQTSFWTQHTSFNTDCDAEEDEEGLEKGSWCCTSCSMSCCSGGGCCHLCYIFAFLCFLVLFPLFLRWMLTAPKPPEFWHREYPKFPLLADWFFVRDDVGSSYNLTMSPIPKWASGCNHSCATGGGFLRASAEMNFDVTLQLDAPGFKHTAYPVLLASNNFADWWVAADKRHSYPKQYFPSQSKKDSDEYRYVTEKCIRPPTISSSMPPSQYRLERPSEIPGYVLACVTWTSAKAAKHRGTKVLRRADLAEFCDAVGGVCGWPCQSSDTTKQLPGCSADGTMSVDNFLGTLADVVIPNATFAGSVSLRSCLPGSKKCITSPHPFSRWRCHKCRNETLSDIEKIHGNHSSNRTKYIVNQLGKHLLYDSLPRMEALLENVTLDMSTPGTMAPQAFIFTSPVAVDGSGADGLLDGAWKKLYDYSIFPAPVPLDEAPVPKPIRDIAQTTLAPPQVIDEARHVMRFTQQNKITIKPDWCFGRRGPLYLVACAVNSSTHLDNFVLKPGQAVAPPPFNDRCLTVSGRCAYACSEDQRPLQYCDSNTGQIAQSELVDKAETKDNMILPVYLFVWTLLFGFATRILSYFPGLFVPYRRAKYYTPQMTEQLKYIAVVTPSGGETKACVLRNLVGALSTRPTDCDCPFHVLYADEGHRHPHKIMFRAFVAVMAHVPDVRLDVNKKSKRLKTGYKEKNLKAFTSQWVELTKMLRLEDCSTDKTVKIIEKLKNQPGSADKVKRLEAQLDALSGVTALKTLQEKAGWPKSEDGPPGSVGMLIRDLENAIQQMKKELVCGEKSFDGIETSEGAKRDMKVPLHLDDHTDYGWSDPAESADHAQPLYNLHYVARAKPPEDERKLKVQHVAQGIWYYAIPKDEQALDRKTWLDWRQNVQEYFPGEGTMNTQKYLVPVRTSRGKAGGLNFAENYLFDFHCRYETPKAAMDPVRFKHALFAIADARHQFQSDFFIQTIPYFFRSAEELNPRVAFTQCPQYFQEMPDESDYLDTNNSNFFRLGCMLRNCCGGVSSCGTNGTWLVRDRRAGKSGTNTMWEMEDAKDMDQGFTQTVERRFFHESCKVEDTASSLDRVVKGKYSQYINMRLAYGMAKAPTDYLAAIQRWAEGGVVLAYQTFLGTEQGVYMIWMTLLLFLGFIVSVFFAVHGNARPFLLSQLFKLLTGDDRVMEWLKEQANTLAATASTLLDQPASSLAAFEDMFFAVLIWLITMTICILGVSALTSLSYILHHNTCCGTRKPARRTRFPTCMAQWARLAITLDNLTYFLWFWTAFFWIGFNYYSVFAVKQFHFEPQGMTMFSWAVAVLVWSLILSASARNTKEESQSSNEVFILSLTNIWRTTQLFYITAPLTVYSILMGTLDFSRNRMFGEDISYWVGGDRGAVSKSIVQWWTLSLLCATAGTWVMFFAGMLPGGGGNVASVLIVTFIGLDVLHPCAFLWLGCEPQPLPAPIETTATGLSGQIQRCCKRTCQLCLSSAFWRNCARSVIFSSRTTGLIKWVAPMQHAILPILTMFFPFLGIHHRIHYRHRGPQKGRLRYERIRSAYELADCLYSL